ncbi:hypothetical protein Y032_0276g1099 [Ancylostoma ceylanicum]|uniref:Uncharacterized protein n=1 Tax=Ancylostoma ceylanicum TaxID=53326 RepID=A0A016S7M7_9BILA|nr:hypothetical protein Y032_0276g1099 [Ancylostoma ceylanicum]
MKAKWSVLQRAIAERARNILGITKQGRPFINKQIWWWSEKVPVLVKKKRDAYKKWLRTRSDDNMREYREAKAEAKKTAVTTKATRYRALYEELDTADGKKKIYRIARARQRATEDFGHLVQIKVNNGRLLHWFRDILNGWREHYHANCNEIIQPADANCQFGVRTCATDRRGRSYSCVSKDEKRKITRCT